MLATLKNSRLFSKMKTPAHTSKRGAIFWISIRITLNRSSLKLRKITVDTRKMMRFASGSHKYSNRKCLLSGLKKVD